MFYSIKPTWSRNIFSTFALRKARTSEAFPVFSVLPVRSADELSPKDLKCKPNNMSMCDKKWQNVTKLDMMWQNSIKCKKNSTECDKPEVQKSCDVWGSPLEDLLKSKKDFGNVSTLQSVSVMIRRRRNILESRSVNSSL